jgi:hypothetical protein
MERLDGEGVTLLGRCGRAAELFDGFAEQRGMGAVVSLELQREIARGGQEQATLGPHLVGGDGAMLGGQRSIQDRDVGRGVSLG